MLPFDGLDSRMKFEADFHLIYPDFFRNLTAKHRTVTPEDLTLCALLVMRCKTEEIAKVLNRTTHTINEHRSKLRQYFGLAKEAHLCTYLMQFAGEGRGPKTRELGKG